MTTLKSKFAQASLGLIAGASLLLTAGTAMAADMFTRNLTVGSTGADVTALQKVLNSNPATALAVAAGNAGSPGNESAYFGPATRAALAKYQALKNISPAVGYFGPLTRGVANAGGTPTPSADLCPNGMTLASNCTMAPGGTTPTQTGPVTVALATTNPAAGTVLTGQATADMLHFTLNGSGTVNSVTLQRTGLSQNSDLSAVYLYNGATRLTDAASVNSSGVITFTGMNLAVNGMMTVSVRADIASTSSYSVGVTMTGFTANGTANTVNIVGNQMYIGSSTGILGTVTMNMSNSNSSTASVNAGATNYTLWTTSLQTNTHAMTLRGASFHFVGSAPTNSLANLSLYVDGVKVGSSTGVNAYNYVVFDLSGSPKVLATGSHTVDVRADIVNGANRTAQLSLQNAGDFMISDNNVVGVNIAPTAAGSTQTAFPLSGNTVTILAGTFSPVIAPSFTTMTNVTGGATNAPIARWNVNSYGEDVKVTSIVLTPTVTNGIANSTTSTSLNNVQLYFNGSQVGSVCQFNGSTACTFTLGSSLIIPAGTTASTIEVRADMQNSSGYNYTSGTVTVANGSIAAQGVYSYNSITSPVLPTTTGLTISTGTLAVGKNASYANQTLNPNTTAAKIASFTIQNQSSSESVRVTNLAVALTSDGSTAATSGLLNNLSNLVTSETSGSGATPTNPQASNNFSVDFTIAPGATKTIDIMASLGTWSAGTYYVTLLPTAYGASSNVVLTPSTATVGQAISLSAGTFGTPTFLSSSSTTTQYVAANGGNTDGTKATFKFTATNGAATISELKFSVTGAGTISSLRINGVANPASVQLTPATTSTAAIVTAGTTLSLTSVSGLSEGSVITVDSEQMLITAISGLDATVTRAINSTSAAWHASGSTVTPNGIAYFSGLNLTVPNGGSGLSIDVYPTYSSVGTNGVTSGTSSSIQLSYEKYTIGGTTTGTAVTPTSITSPTMVVVGSKPVVSVLATPTNRLSAGTIEAINVTVAADAKGDITLNSLPITVTLNAASMITAATIVVKDAGGNTLTTANTVDPFDGYLGGTSTINFTNGYLIQAGTTATFRIYVPIAAVTGTGVNGASMATSLATATFGWTDTAGGGSATMGTTYMYNYPSTSTAVIYN